MPENIFETITWDDIEVEKERLINLFQQIPDSSNGFKSGAASLLIFEIVNWASRSHYEALGILEEAIHSYRESAQQVQEDEKFEEVQLKSALDSVQKYQCIKEFDFGNEREGVVGSTYSIGYAGEDDRYDGDIRYFVFLEEELKESNYYSICKDVLETYFQLIED